MKHSLIICALLGLSSAANAQDTDPSHRLMSERPEIGSNMLHQVGKSRINIYKKYEDLSDADKALLRAPYGDMQANDEPPFPLYGLAPVLKKLARMNLRRENEGNVRLLVLIDTNGEAESVRFLQFPTLDTAKAVASILVSTKYKPGRCDGNPCKMDYLFDLNLEVPL